MRVEVLLFGSVQFQGACARCPGQLGTLRFGIEAALRREVPAVTQVVPVEPRER